MLPIIGKSYITQGYGLTEFAKSSTGRAAYKNFPGGIHPGIDFGTSGVNRVIISLIKGKVVFADRNGGWGNYIEVEGADGWRRQYAHLSAIFVKKGDTVEVGTELGRVGTTGMSTGIHLHYGHRRWNLYKWEYRDPSIDFEDVEVKEAKMPKGKLIKGIAPEVFVFTGKRKHYIPDMETLKFFFGDLKIEQVDESIASKIPNGTPLPSVK